jgi:hypothetical protein
MLLFGTNFSRSTIFVLSTSSAFTSSAVKVRNWPRLYSYPLRTSRLSISSPVPGSCGRSVIRTGDQQAEAALLAQGGLEVGRFAEHRRDAARHFSPRLPGAGRDMLQGRLLAFED